jgi:hypothetical protein
MKKKLYGNYLGIVITGAESDPENRGRCQIYFPGVSNTLYKKINKNLKDLSFGHIDPNILTPDIIQDLRTVLPWSECAAPIAGGGTSAFHNPVTGKTALGFQETINPDVQTADIHKTPDPPAWSDVNANPSDVELSKTFQPIQSTISGNSTVSTINTSNMEPAFKAQYERVYNALNGTKFANMSESEKPKDGATYGINKGTREEWAHFFTRIAATESSFNPNTKDGNRSFGLYQMGQEQFNSFGGGNISNPDANTNSFVRYAESMYFGTGKYGQYGGQNRIAFRDNSLPGGYGGISAGYGPLQRSIGGNFITDNEKQVLGENMSASERQKRNYTSTQVASTNPESTYPNREAVDDAPSPAPTFAGYSGRPHGVFSFPRMGAKLWAFFYGGDIQRPVYFAAAYEPDSIRYATGASSPPTKLSISAERDAIDAQAAADLPKDSTSEYKGFEAINQAGCTLESSVEVSGNKNEGNPFAKSSFNLYNLEGTGISSDGGLWNIGNPANSGGSIRGSEEGININSTGGDIVLTGNVKVIGDLTVNSGTTQKDQKKTEKYLAEEQAAVDQIAKQTANDIAQGGEEINCPLCEQKLADDKSDFVTKILRTIQKYSNILPWDCWNWGVTKFLINFIVMPMLNEISALAVSGGEGCGMCDKGKVRSYSQSIENANKKASETFAQKQNEINESAKDFKPGSNVTNVTGSAGINAGFQHVNNAPCSKELKDDCSCIPTGMKKGEGAKANPLHPTGEKVPTVVYIVPNKTSAGDITFQSANDIRMTAGSPGIKMETNGKISITGGFLDLNSMDGPAVLTSKNVTNVNGAKVHITGAKGVAITAPSTSVNGNLAITGNLGVKGSITLDGALSVKHLKIKTMRSETTSNSSPKSTSNATTYYTGGAAGINIFDKIKNVLVRDNPLKMLMLTPKGLLTIFQEVYDRILLMIGIHPVPTGFFVGYGSGVVYNFTSNSSKVPDDHSHQFDAPQMTRAADNAAWVNMADDPSSEAPNPAPSQGDDPVGGPHSLAGCGGGGFGFGGNSNASRRRSARNSRYGVPRNSLNYGNITPQGYFNGVTITTNNTILSGLSGGFITTTTDLSGNIITINNSITGNGLDIVYDFNPNSQKWEYDTNGEIKPRDLVRFSISEDCL